MANTTRTELQAFSSIGIDIGKDVLHLVGFDRSGQIVLRRKIKRLALVNTFEALSPCIVGMEAMPDMADRGFDADWIRAFVNRRGAWANFPP